MSKSCVYRSPDPMANNVYKFPETRYVCRCAARLSVMKLYSDRFIGDEVCNTCEFYTESNKEENVTGSDSGLPID